MSPITRPQSRKTPAAVRTDPRTLAGMERTRQTEVAWAVWAAAAGPRHASPAPTELLVEGVREHPDPVVRRNALLALDRADDRWAVRAALAALRDDVPRVRRQAIHVLTRRPLTDVDEVLPYLRVLARTDPSPAVRRAAARAVGSVPDERAA